jgi:fluoride ion exporter CrcB/FEX
MKIILFIAFGALLFAALRYWVVGMNGLATYRRRTPVVYWIGVFSLGLLWSPH